MDEEKTEQTEKKRLIYGTYNRKEWEKILDIFEELEIPYKEGVHVTTHGERPDTDAWYFYHLEAEVDAEQEKNIRTRRDLLKKLYR